MPNTYKITVINKTGGPQDYAFFNAPPIISGGASGAVWSNVMNTARNTPNDGQASFEVSLTYYATCGSFEGSLDQGSRVEVSKSVPIQLGSSNGGNITMGSSISLTVYDRSACDLGPPTNPGQGKLGNFQLDTACKPENAFTMQDAKDREFDHFSPLTIPWPHLLTPEQQTTFWSVSPLREVAVFPEPWPPLPRTPTPSTKSCHRSFSTSDPALVSRWGILSRPR